MDILIEQLQIPGQAREVIGDAAQSLSQCDEGCTQCNDAWMSDDDSNVY